MKNRFYNIYRVIKSNLLLIVKYFAGFILLILVCIAIRVFIVEIYNVPTTSMKNTIRSGDYIIVNKLKYGPLLPSSMSKIPWVGIFWNNEKNKHAKGKRLRTENLPKQGDVICFFSEKISENVFVKRCVAIPGDTIQFKKDVIAINSIDDSLRFDANYSKIQSNLFTSPPLPNIYLKMGSVVLPKQNRRVKINLSNYFFYVRLIKDFENQEIKIKNDSIYINGIKAENYIFKENYYFVMGDNRAFSIDSRHFGPIPEYSIIGNVGLVLFSFKDKMRWDRLFKTIR